MIVVKDAYNTIVSRSIGEFKNKGSKFFGYAFPVKNEQDIDAYLEEVKSEHHKARHHCYAYKLGMDDNNYRYNDDGEPSGTAGKPIYGQLLSSDITDVLIVVVRYFGGTKLGVSGLIEAYKEAAKSAINNNEIIEKFISCRYELEFNYAEMGEIMNIIKSLELNIVEKTFDNTCKVMIELRLSKEIELITKLKATLLNVSEEYITDETKVEFCAIRKMD